MFSLDPDVAHVNNGSLGAVPVPVQQAQAEYRRRAEANPLRFYRLELPDLLARARVAAGEFLGATDDGVALVPNTTTGVATVLAAVDLGPGSEILISDHAYGAVARACQVRAERVGATVRTVGLPLSAEPDAVVRAFTEALRPETTLLVVDAITSVTALVLPVAEVVAAGHAHGVPVLVDAAHVPGHLDAGPLSTGADFWIGNFHKWAYAARGTAGLWVAPEYRERTAPLVTSWGHSAGFPQWFDSTGTEDQSAWLALPEACAFWHEQGGWDAVRRSSDLADCAVRIVADALRVPGPASARHAPLMRLVELPADLAGDAEATQDVAIQLSLRHQVEAMTTWWGGRGYLRLSSQVYNSEDDYRATAAALLRVRSTAQPAATTSPVPEP